MSHDEWQAKGEQLFGTDIMRWKFICPSCGHIASVQDWKDAGAPEGAVAFSCVGRYLPRCSDAFTYGVGPCNYAGGGLFGLNPIDVDGRRTFAFKEDDDE